MKGSHADVVGCIGVLEQSQTALATLGVLVLSCEVFELWRRAVSYLFWNADRRVTYIATPEVEHLGRL